MNDAGRVGYVLRGDYNPSTKYEFLDVVNFNGGSYVARQTTTGHAPTETTYWYPQSNTHIATASTLGVVKVDNDTIKIQQDGTLVGSQSGHTIRNTMNTDATPKETNLRFAGAKITDDSTNETTKVEFYYEYPTLAAAQADMANIPEGARVIVKEADYVGQIDNALSLTSVNPVQNKVVTEAISGDVLWENDEGTFSSTSFTVDLTKYKSFKLITTEGTCECATSGARASNFSSSVTNIWYSNGSAKLVGYLRFFTLDVTTSTLAIGVCTSINDGSVNNSRNVPIKVIGYTT